MATSLSVIGASTEALKVRVLDRVLCICYPIQFCKDKDKDVLALLNSESKVNVITLAYAAHLGLTIKVTDIGAQKIDGSLLANYGIVIAVFQVVDKLGRSRFFQETFLLANISIKVVLSLLFLTLSNANVQFAEKKLTWKTYITKEALPTTHQVEIIDRKKFAKVSLNANVEAFEVHVSSLRLRMNMHTARKA